MTQTSARTLAGSQAALSPLRREGLPSFLLAMPSGLVLQATRACAPLGLRDGEPAPAPVARAAADLARMPLRSFGFARLRLPGALVPRLFRYAPLSLPAGPAILFADPAAFQESAPAEPQGPRAAYAPPVPAEFRASFAQPLRITFETDAEGRICAVSPLLAEALGSRAASVMGRSFADLEAEGLIASGDAAAAAMAGGGSFSDLRISVPAQAPDDLTLELDLGGVPLFDAARRRRAVRGFGVLRIAARPAVRTAAVAADAPLFDGEAAFGENVVPLRGGNLSPQERSAFREIARTLAAAIEDWPKPQPEGVHVLPPQPEAGPSVEDAPGGGADLLDRLPVGLLVQQDGEVAYANQTFLAWSGWADLADLTAAGGLDRVLGRDPNGTLHLNTTDGRRMPAEVRLVAAPFLGRPALLHVIRKLDPKEEREDRAVARREALDMIPWPVFLLEPEGTIRLANHAAGERLGFAAFELAGEPFTIAVAPQDRAAAIAALDRVAMSSGPEEAVLTLRDRSGATFPMRTSITRAGAEHQVLCVVMGPASPEPEPAAAPATDAADHVPAADHLPHLARRMMESLGAPIATALDFAAAAEAAPPALPDPVREALSTLRQSLDDLSALAAPVVPAGATPCDLADLVRAACAGRAPAAERRGVALRPDLPDTLSVTADAPRLTRLVRMMIEDAVSATPAGGTVTISLTSGPDASACLQVTDEGPALDEVSRAAALAPLSAADGDDRFSTARRPLRMARLAADAEALGGAMTLREDLSRGMTARLTLPA